MSAILGGLIGIAIGYVAVRLAQWWDWRNGPPRQAYSAPMSTAMPTTAELPSRDLAEWGDYPLSETYPGSGIYE